MLQVPLLCFQRSGCVTSVVFSPDGRWLASGGFDETLGVWQAETGRLAFACKEEGNRNNEASCVCSLHFHPSGELLAYVTPNDEVCVRETGTWQKLPVVDDSIDAAMLSFSPDGRLLALGLYDHWLYLWDVWGRAPLGELNLHSRPTALGFSPDGALLAVATRDSTIQLLDVASVRIIRSVFGHVGEIFAVSFSPDGRLLASGGADTGVNLWRTQDWSLIGKLEDPTGWTHALAFSPDGLVLASAGAKSGIIRLWHTGNLTFATLCGHSSFVLSLCYSADGTRLASGGQDNTVRIWGSAQMGTLLPND
jgi:WD40 repeat protein